MLCHSSEQRLTSVHTQLCSPGQVRFQKHTAEPALTLIDMLNAGKQLRHKAVAGIGNPACTMLAALPLCVRIVHAVLGIHEGHRRIAI